MKWEGRRQSKNVEDRRGMSGGKLAAGGGIAGVIIALIFSLLSGNGIDPNMIGEIVGGGGEQAIERELTPEEIKTGEMVATIMADTEDVWGKIFREEGLGTYKEPVMVMFTGGVNTACGSATSAVGPFYCPGDHKVYMDLDFFNELQTRFGAKGGDFAIAYVIAHEVGHHVQTLLGTNAEVSKIQRQSSEKVSNQYSVALELQADFYAGVWAHHIQKYIDGNDIEIALDAAKAVGDDAIQKRVQGHVVPDSFTHGSSKQRMEWFMRGYKSGDIRQGDTFSELIK